MKKCSKCGVTRDYSEFSKSAQTKDGCYPYCKPCMREKWRAKHPNPVFQKRLDLEARGMKTCSFCKKELPLAEFVKCHIRKSGVTSVCKPCMRNRGVKRDKTNLRTVVATMYTSMRRRANKHGWELIDRDDFISLAMKSKPLRDLHNTWVRTNMKRALTPSVDRIDANKGYSRSNIQFITLFENERKDVARVQIRMTRLDKVLEFDSVQDAATYFGVDWHTIGAAIDRKTPLKSMKGVRDPVGWTVRRVGQTGKRES